MEKLWTDIGENIRRIRNRIGEAAVGCGRDPGEIALMAVTKTVPAEVVNMAVEHGVRLLGENRAQELNAKYGDYRKDGVSIHFIGSLQTNKVRQIIDKVELIHSVDSLRLGTEIGRQAEKRGTVMDILIEVNVGGEGSKSGASPEELPELVAGLGEISGVRLRGLMAIPPYSDDPLQNERHFSRMRQLFVDIQGKSMDNSTVNILSMGMSGDYAEAVKHGSTLVRLGTALFGARG